MPPKKLSGYQGRKRKAEQEKQIQKCQKISSFFKSTNVDRQSDDSESESELQHIETESTCTDSDLISSSKSLDVEEYCSNPEPDLESDHSIVDTFDVNSHSETVNSEHNSLDVVPSIQDYLSDIGKWPQNIGPNIDLLVRRGPEQIINFDFPLTVQEKEGRSRKFCSTNYYRTLPNGEKIQRKWLVYSKSNDAVFCFACKLFSKKEISLTVNGLNDWKNVSARLKEHEKTIEHLKCISTWNDLVRRLNEGKTIDSFNKKLVNENTIRWRNVLERLFEIIKLHGSQNLALRGTSDKLYEDNNGNFLKIVELIAKFDPILKEHVRQIKNKELHVHYLGKRIQNEMITLLNSAVKEKITNLIKLNKYYSIIVDCTPDVSHIEQMSLIVRVVCPSSDEKHIEVHEHFLSFIEIDNSSGAGITDKIIEVLESHNLSVANMRGQSYDNGSNMRGRHSGVQSRILNLNPRAFFVPCSAHTLNLVVNDSASCCVEGITFFDIIQHLYVFFSSSTQRWALLKKHITGFTLKSLSETRWASRIDALKPLRYHLKEVIAALYDCMNEDGQPNVTTVTAARNKSEATAILQKIEKYKFICSLIVWYDILFDINVTSKAFQAVSLNLSQAVTLLSKSMVFLEDYRTDAKFDCILEEAKTIAIDLDIDVQFERARVRRQRRQFDYEQHDEVFDDPIQNFKVNFFNNILDNAIQSLRDRFQLIQEHNNKFELLYNFGNITNITDDDIQKYCMDLELLLTDGDQKDISGLDLFDELKYIKSHLSTDCCDSPTEILNYLLENNLTTALPNIYIALRIIITLPITVASAERSFSKLKLIKTYLRSTMLQDRLDGLATLSIERDLVRKLELDDLINNFAAMKARKKVFM